MYILVNELTLSRSNYFYSLAKIFQILTLSHREFPPGVTDCHEFGHRCVKFSQTGVIALLGQTCSKCEKQQGDCGKFHFIK